IASRTDRTRGTLCVLLKTPIVVMMPCHKRKPSYANTRVRGRGPVAVSNDCPRHQISRLPPTPLASSPWKP
ncbi:unnamed protein product, partial [Ectocarpus sp. 12 AP-2014]